MIIETLRAQPGEIHLVAIGPLTNIAFALQREPLATHRTDPDDPDCEGQAVHDVCAVAYLARPDLFTTRTARVEVETVGELTAGMTVTDFRSASSNTVVPVRLEVDGFWDYVLDAWSTVVANH